jgi:CheY-like chemotaxis protein
VDLFENENFDVVFLDENMPGMSGLAARNEGRKRVLSHDYDY